ncbi:MAG: hypothetical protein IBX53_00495 [Halomonas sp.]|uniref:hypothetical protein n=1 Tax=Halomonas sp. TaxID=1486246 RepID=UPI0019DCC0AE|nr:hypothetical protein [Halomonas sp.]MBE0487529.1 hypothetical protein [Halomonas sp.]
MILTSRFTPSLLRRAVAAGMGGLALASLPALANYDTLPEASGVDLPIPAQVGDDGEALFYQEAFYHRDLSAVQHAMASVGRIMRDSEMGHEGYDANLAEAPMAAQGQAWLDLQQQAAAFFTDEGAVGTMVQEEGEWVPGREMNLADLAQAAFSYHMHHSAGRWADHGLEEAITFGPAGYLGAITQRLTQSHYGQRGFQDVESERDAASLAHGLDVLHSQAYSWVRWDKPGGADDMGQLSEERMEAAHGISLERLVEISRNLAGTLDAAWDGERRIYDLDNDGAYHLDTLGSLVRGHKALYEILYVFGEEDDRDLAAQLFERKADMTLALLDSDQALRDWGLAERVVFTGEGVKADGERIDTESQWRFLNHLTGGFGTLRERDGTSSFLETRPELGEGIGELSDRLLQAALDYQLGDDGLMQRRLAVADGEVIDERHQVAAIAWFATAAGNAYRSGEAFERPGDWGDDTELEARSRALYDAIRANNDWLLTLLD